MDHNIKLAASIRKSCTDGGAYQGKKLRNRLKDFDLYKDVSLMKTSQGQGPGKMWLHHFLCSQVQPLLLSSNTDAHMWQHMQLHAWMRTIKVPCCYTMLCSADIISNGNEWGMSPKRWW